VVKIRLMGEKDINVVRQIDAHGFAPWLERYIGDSTQLPLRTTDNIRSSISNDPKGAFVAEVENEVVGFIFSRTWGGVGWFGTFAVLPEHQGKGIGKKLLSSSLEYLTQRPDRTIGLETMPDSSSNLGFYLKSGFQPSLPTFQLSKQVSPETVGDIVLPHWSSADNKTQQKWLSELLEATNQIYPGLDYSKEIITTTSFGFGETLILIADDQAIGFSTVRLSSLREGLSFDSARIEVMAIHPEFTSEEKFSLLINATMHLARMNNKQALIVSVNACHSWALNQLLSMGFIVESMMIRMVMAGTDKEIPMTDSVNLSHWSG
jgi:ribosomal protein S18 acetylase RimI-like enzyme